MALPIKQHFLNLAKRIDHEGKIVEIIYICVFYLSLYFIQNNRQLLLLFLIVASILSIRFKKWLATATILYIFFLPFFKGKTFVFDMIPAWVLGRNASYSFGFTITFSDLAFTGIAIALLVKKVNQYKHMTAQQLPKIDILLFLFIACTLVSIFFSQYQIVSFLAFIKLFRTVITYFVAKTFFHDKSLKRVIPIIISISLLFEGFWASAQFILQRPLGRSIEQIKSVFTYGQTAQEDLSLFRAQGTFDHPNTLGIFSVILLAFLGILLCDPDVDKRVKKVYELSIFLGFCALIFSYSRANWFTFMVIFILEIFFVKAQARLHLPTISKWRVITGIITLCVFTSMFVIPRLGHFNDAFSGGAGANYRIGMIQKSWFLSLAYPLGIGLATFPAHLVDTFDYSFWPAPVHNIFFEILVETGILSLIFFLIFLVLTYKKFSNTVTNKKNSGGYSIKIGSMFATLAFLLSANFYPFLWSSGVFEYFWLFLGIMI